MTPTQMQDFIDLLDSELAKINLNWYVKSPEYRLKQFNEFSSKYYSDLDCLKNISDDMGFVFDRIKPEYQEKFTSVCNVYDQINSKVAITRQEQRNYEIAKVIDEVHANRQRDGLSSQTGLFANGRKPTSGEVTKAWLESYSHRVVI